MYHNIPFLRHTSTYALPGYGKHKRDARISLKNVKAASTDVHKVLSSNKVYNSLNPFKQNRVTNVR